MSRRILIRTCLLLTVTIYAQAQYVDFFQSFNSFLQPFTTSKPRNDVTKRPTAKHRQTTKQKYQDAIFFETDDFLKQRDASKTVDPFNIYSTTTKPRRKSTKTSTTSQNYSYYTTSTTIKPNKLDNSNKIINNNRNVNHEVIRSVSNNNRENNFDNRPNNNARRIDNYNNNGNNDNGYNIYNWNGATTKPSNFGQNYNNDRQTTQRTTTRNYYTTKTTQKPDYYGYSNDRTTHRPYNRLTTKNPLLNRPGVKPAAVDENRPPITNRPVTERPFYERPISPVTRPNLGLRPVNTRPPFEAERPISTGVARPVVVNEASEVDIELGPDEDEMSDAEKRKLYDICEQKCEEFKAMRVKKVVALPLASGRPGVEVNVSSCAPDTAPLIIGGQLARIETFPHMALVGWKNLQSDGYAWKCGGSLLSERYVLTAGHCTYHDKDYNVVSGPPSAVQLGSGIYNDRTATVVKVSLVVRHPKYKLRRSYHDVALIKLAVEVSFSDSIMPACLGVPPAVGEPVIATGWGKTEFGGDSSIQLRSVSIPVWDMNECREIWGTSLKLPSGPQADNQICAGERQGAKDTCQGDSGGPAQVRDACAWRVVAVTSVGRSCGAPETPALYATIPRAFIAKQVYTNINSGQDGGNLYENGNGGNNGNTNWNTRNNNNNNNNNFQTVNRGVVDTRPTQNNNADNYNNGGRVTNNNNQYYTDSQGSTTDNRGIVNNNQNWGVTNNNNNRYNGNNNDQGYNNNAQTTNGYGNQYMFSLNNNYNGNNFGLNQNIRATEKPNDVRHFSSILNPYNNNNNGRMDNAYNRNNDNRYPIPVPVPNRPWWTR